MNLHVEIIDLACHGAIDLNSIVARDVPTDGSRYNSALSSVSEHARGRSRGHP